VELLDEACVDTITRFVKSNDNLLETDVAKLVA